MSKDRKKLAFELVGGKKQQLEWKNHAYLNLLE